MSNSIEREWESSYLRFCADNQHLVPAILERERAKFAKPKMGGDMQGNHRGPIYASVQGAVGRVLTPDEKIRLDRLLDSIGVPTRFK